MTDAQAVLLLGRLVIWQAELAGMIDEDAPPSRIRRMRHSIRQTQIRLGPVWPRILPTATMPVAA
jgi:hypothetical protein